MNENTGVREGGLVCVAAKTPVSEERRDEVREIGEEAECVAPYSSWGVCEDNDSEENDATAERSEF